MAHVNAPVPGIRIVDNIEAQDGVETLEGRIGPLVSAERGSCHFIEMPPGAYCEAHAHATESLIYTVRGQWVLHSGGQRFHMRPGALFWFGDGVATGYEVPFGNPAYILIFKSSPRASDEEFFTYLRGMEAGLVKDSAGGTPFRFSELADDHPAKLFARTIGAAV